VCHLLNGGWVSQDQALALVCRVHVETQEILNAEHGHLGLLLVDNQPVRQAFCARYEQTMARVRDL
jgi:hypothetical protein